jgi:hypothetical protein
MQREQLISETALEGPVKIKIIPKGFLFNLFLITQPFPHPLET